jgi:hypothetical protein
MGPDVLIFGIESLLCVAALLCAIASVLMRRRSALRACGLIIVALSTLIVSEVIGAAVLDARETARATPQVSHPELVAAALPASAPRTADNDTEALRSFRRYWADIVRVSASALKAHDRAGEDLRTGHAAPAAEELRYCQEVASGIASYPSGLALDIDNGSDLELSAAVRKLGDGLVNGCKSARAYLSTNVAADFSEAKTRFNDVVDAIVQSESLARQKYQRLGGNPDALSSFKTALR